MSRASWLSMLAGGEGREEDEGEEEEDDGGGGISLGLHREEGEEEEDDDEERDCCGGGSTSWCWSVWDETGVITKGRGGKEGGGRQPGTGENLLTSIIG